MDTGTKAASCHFHITLGYQAAYDKNNLDDFNSILILLFFYTPSQILSRIYYAKIKKFAFNFLIAI